MSTILPIDPFSEDDEGIIKIFNARRLPRHHPAEADLFARHAGIPGHHQEKIGSTRAATAIVGAGGVGCPIAIMTARSGCQFMMIMDHDRYDRTNAPRQYVKPKDIGENKAIVLASNIVEDGHMVAGGSILAVGMPFTEALAATMVEIAVMIVGIDNNQGRVDAAKTARTMRVPAVFVMLSPDSHRYHCFLQGPNPSDACLACCFPDVDPTANAPCVDAIITGCMHAASVAVFLAHRALCGWPDGVDPYNFREGDLMATYESRVGRVEQRPDCWLCGAIS